MSKMDGDRDKHTANNFHELLNKRDGNMPHNNYI